MVELRYSILNLDTRWWVVSFTPRPLHPRKKRSWYPLPIDEKAGWGS